MPKCCSRVLPQVSIEYPAPFPYCRSRPGPPETGDFDICPEHSGYLTLVGSFPKLLVVTWLLNEIQEFFGEVGICERVGLRIYISLSLWGGNKASVEWNQNLPQTSHNMVNNWGTMVSFPAPSPPNTHLTNDTGRHTPNLEKLNQDFKKASNYII